MSIGASNEIKSYRAYVDIDGGFCGIILQFEGEPTVHLRIDNLTIYQSAIDMLRNEKPVFYDQKRKFIQTGQEGIGEGEE